MPIFDSVRAWQAKIAPDFPGRSIFAFPGSSGASDSFDGTEDSPYLTVGRALQDARSGRGDKVFVLNTIGLNNVQREARIDLSKSGLAIIGIGVPELGPPTGVGTVASITLTRLSTSTVRFTQVGHGLVVGDVVYLAGFEEAGGNRVNGPWDVSVVAGNDVTLAFTIASTPELALPGGATTQAPFDGASDGTWAASNLVIQDARAVSIYGMGFACAFSSTFQTWACVRGNAVLANATTRDVRFYDCYFRDAFPHFYRMSAPGSTPIPGPGFGLRVEGGYFTKNYIDVFADPDNQSPGLFPHLSWGGVAELFIGSNTFTSDALTFVGPNDFRRILRSFGIQPRLGVTIAANIFDTAKFAGATVIDREQAIYGRGNDLANASSNSVDFPDQIRASRNFYPESGASKQVVLISADFPTKTDREGAPFMNADALPQLDDLIFGRTASVLASVPDTAGEILALTIYRGAVHFDSTATANTNTVVGVDGTPANPVTSEAALRALLTSTGFRSAMIRGALTMTLNFDGISFEGISPRTGVDSVTVNGGSHAGATFSGLRLLGTLSGASDLERCIVGSGGTVSGIGSGIWREVGVQGTIVPVNGAVIQALKLGSTGLTTATIDFSGGDVTFLAQDAFGVLTIANMAANDVLGLNGDGLDLTLAASVNGGLIRLGKIRSLTDNKTAVGVFLDNGFDGAHVEQVYREDGYVFGLVWFDDTRGSAGTGERQGTPTQPVDNSTDALSILSARDLDGIAVAGQLTLGAADDVRGHRFEGVGGEGIISFSGTAGVGNWRNLTLNRLHVSAGAAVDGTNAILHAFDTEFLDELINFNGSFHRCGLYEVRPFASAGVTQLVLDQTYTQPAAAGQPLVLDFQNFTTQDVDVIIRGHEGPMTIRNLSTTGVANFCIQMKGGLTLEASVTTGTFGVSILGPFTDASTGTTVNVTQATDLNQRRLIDITTDPWREYVYDAGGTKILDTFELYDQDGVAIAGDHTAGNNPLFDNTRLLAERRKV